MLLRCFYVMLFSGIFFCATVGAAVFERDWQTPGDGLLTFDDVNQREWLDLSETILDQFLGATLEDKYQSVVAETASGGMFEDFTVAKGNDAEALALSAGIDITTGDFATNEIVTRNIIDLLGVTLVVTSERFASFGAVDETQNVFQRSRQVAANFSISDRSSSGFISTAGFSIDLIGELANITNTGAMLYRKAIPEPGSIVLVFQTSLLLLAVHRRRRR